MGDGEKASLRLQFNPKVRLAFHGATITTDAGLLAFREFDDALGLTEIAEDYLQESRTGRNILHHLVPLLRQSIYSRLVLQRQFREGCGVMPAWRARRLAWERLARSLLSCVSSSHRSNSVGPNRSRGSISRTTR